MCKSLHLLSLHEFLLVEHVKTCHIWHAHTGFVPQMWCIPKVIKYFITLQLFLESCNPLIYSLFSETGRKAFHRRLDCHFKDTPTILNPKTSLVLYFLLHTTFFFYLVVVQGLLWWIARWIRHCEYCALHTHTTLQVPSVCGDAFWPDGQQCI